MREIPLKLCILQLTKSNKLSNWEIFHVFHFSLELKLAKWNWLCSINNKFEEVDLSKLESTQQLSAFRWHSLDAFDCRQMEAQVQKQTGYTLNQRKFQFGVLRSFQHNLPTSTKFLGPVDMWELNDNYINIALNGQQKSNCTFIGVVSIYVQPKSTSLILWSCKLVATLLDGIKSSLKC